jgi:RimJ/RimL family protein N-acetyltransferase
MEPVEITAGRLHLRPWTPYDEDTLVAGMSDAESARWTPVPVPFTREEARRRLTELFPQLWETGTGAQFAVLDATTGQVVAWVGLFGIKDGAAEIGWTCWPEARGTGVTSEAVAALCRWGFSALDLKVIEAVIAVGNWGSRAVAQKCGFTVEGTRRMGMEQRGTRIDAWGASLLSTDELVDRRPLPRPPVLSDGVVSVRAFVPSDAPDVARACGDPVIAQWLPVPVPYTEQDARTYVETVAPAGWADGTSATFAVTDAQSGELWGDISLKLPHRHPLRFGEIGYWTAPWARGHGAASRASALVAHWGLRELGLNRVELVADVENHASVRAAEKAGFVREGTARKARPRRDGTGSDMAQFSLVHADLATH